MSSRQFARLFFHLVHRDLRVRYSRSILGLCWLFVNPLLLVAVYSFVFAVVVRVPVVNYPVFLLAGLVPWNWFARSVSRAGGSMKTDACLLRLRRLPPEIFVLKAVVLSGIDCLAALAILILVQMWSHPTVLVRLPFLLLVVLLQGVFIFGISLPLSLAGTVCGDVDHATSSVLKALFFLTPVVYSKTMLPEGCAFVASLNPLAWYVSAFRQVLYECGAPSEAALARLALAACLAVGAGWGLFRRRSDLVPELA